MAKKIKFEWQPGEHFETETKNLVLRTLRPDDITEEYVGWWNDPKLQQGFGNPGRNWTIDKARKHAVRFDNTTNFHLGVFWKKTGKLIGFYAMSIDPRNKVSSTNVMIGDTDYWKKGLATEISCHMISLRFKHMGVEKIETKVKGENLASFGLHKALGFKKEGVLRNHCVLPGKVRGDIHLYGMLKDEWKGHD